MGDSRKWAAEQELHRKDQELLDAIDKPPYRLIHEDDKYKITTEGCEIKDTNPKKAFGDKKIPLQLVPPAASAYIAMGLREGALKYGPWNFRETPIDLMTYIGAIKRHCDAILEGEWIDPDPMLLPDGTEITDIPKKPHLAGIMASAAILADQFEAGKLVDNRPQSNGGYFTLMKENMKNV